MPLYKFDKKSNVVKASHYYGPNDDDTSGTSDFEESTINEPDDCYCEDAIDIERLSPDILLRPADKYYLDNIIEWKLQTVLEGYPNEQPPPEEYNKISNYVKNETPKMLDDTRIIMNVRESLLSIYDKMNLIKEHYDGNDINGFKILHDDVMNHMILEYFENEEGV